MKWGQSDLSVKPGREPTTTIDVRELAAALLVALSPRAAAVEITGELIVAEAPGRLGLVDVFTSPYVREGGYFGGSGTRTAASV